MDRTVVGALSIQFSLLIFSHSASGHLHPEFGHVTGRRRPGAERSIGRPSHQNSHIISNDAQGGETGVARRDESGARSRGGVSSLTVVSAVSLSLSPSPGANAQRSLVRRTARGGAGASSVVCRKTTLSQAWSGNCIRGPQCAFEMSMFMCPAVHKLTRN